MMSIGEAARRTGLSAYTIRYYEEAGLVAAPARLRNGHRDYCGLDVRILACVAALRRAGMPVKEMKSFLLELRATQGVVTSDAIAPEVIQRCVGSLRCAEHSCPSDRVGVRFRALEIVLSGNDFDGDIAAQYGSRLRAQVRSSFS